GKYDVPPAYLKPIFHPTRHLCMLLRLHGTPDPSIPSVVVRTQPAMLNRVTAPAPCSVQQDVHETRSNKLWVAAYGQPSVRPVNRVLFLQRTWIRYTHFGSNQVSQH